MHRITLAGDRPRKELLAAAPLDGIDLERSRDKGRDFELG
jgi:hypothetical protein